MACNRGLRFCIIFMPRMPQTRLTTDCLTSGLRHLVQKNNSIFSDHASRPSRTASKFLRLQNGAIAPLHCLTAPVARMASAIIAIGQGEGPADYAVATAAAPMSAAHIDAVAVDETAATSGAATAVAQMPLPKLRWPELPPSNAELGWGTPAHSEPRCSELAVLPQSWEQTTTRLCRLEL